MVLPRGFFIVYNTDPNDTDTDDDGFSDGFEILTNADPLDLCDPLGSFQKPILKFFLPQ